MNEIKLTNREKEVLAWLRKGERYYINPIVFRNLWAKKLVTLETTGVQITKLGKTIKL